MLSWMLPSLTRGCAVGALLALCAAPPAAFAQQPACPSGALGTARVMEVDTSQGLRVGRKSYPQTLPLQPREVLLTFDDGPAGATTAAILDALRRECVRATFFVIGQNAAAQPALVRRIVAEGHSLGHHTQTHPILNTIPHDRAVAEIEQGLAAIERAAGAGAGRIRSFFRFPGFGATPALEAYAASRGMGVFGADFWASDWNVMTPDAQLQLVLRRLDEAQGGIVLFHDTKQQTASMIPAFLTALKQRGYRVVHIVAR
jgi:peptidoglycan/xylan/chitin deacetylase (PgdA/CDA1 family)